MESNQPSTETMELKLNQPKGVTNTKNSSNSNNSSSNNSPKNKTLLFLESISSLFDGNNPRKSSFRSNENAETEVDRDGTPLTSLPIPELSPFANSVISRCAEILQTSAKTLQDRFDIEVPENIRQPSSYGRNFLEFCSYQALYLTTKRSDYLSDKDIRRLIFDMMVAWEAPGVENDRLNNDTASCSGKEAEEEDGWSLFYSSSTKTAVQVDEEKTVGPEAFARIAPACLIIADITTVHNLFDVLTSSSGHRLHFLIFEKYIRSLEKVTKAVQSGAAPQLVANLSLAENEIILDIDGTVPTQPVLQHAGISAWPGRLTLTNYALYFESGVGIYDKAVRYDLETDLKQVIKPELTGPLGARLFDKAVMYKSTSMAEPVFLEFPEFKGSLRRDYWLDISLEVLRAHKFVRKYHLKENQRSEALARAILGVFRYRALREAFKISSTNYRTLLCFNLAESLPGGDLILETLSRRLALMNPTAVRLDSWGSPNSQRQPHIPIALLTLSSLGIIIWNKPDVDGEETSLVGDVSVGEMNPLEMAVKQSKQNTGKAEAAQASVDQVKVEGIDTNLAVMKELLLPFIEILNRLQSLASWESPIKSLVFLLVIGYMILWGWIKYVLPSVLVFVAAVMLWRRYTETGKTLEAFKIKTPPSKNAVEQLLLLQDGITQAEAILQSGNVVILKVRALLFAVVPQATDKVALVLIFLAMALALLPLKYFMFIVFLDPYTRNMPLRKDSCDRWLRRVREWWIRIPAAPVQLVVPDDKKKK